MTLLENGLFQTGCQTTFIEYDLTKLLLQLVRSCEHSKILLLLVGMICHTSEHGATPAIIDIIHAYSYMESLASATSLYISSFHFSCLHIIQNSINTIKVNTYISNMRGACFILNLIQRSFFSRFKIKFRRLVISYN